jgi:hypothetical protein
MAAPDVDDSFVKQYEREVHEAYQREGSKLRNTVRKRSKVTGSSTTFQKIGTGTATTKARHGAITPMNLDHTPVECTLSDWYAGEWIDKLDELKEAHDERRVAVNAGAWALGRKTDEQIITALDATTNTVAVSTTGLTKAKIYSAFETLGNNDVFEEGRMYALVGYEQWTNLLDLTEFASAEYVGAGELPFIKEGMEVKRWMGTMWMTHSGLPLSGSTRKVFWYRDDAIGHGSGAEVVTDVTWHGDRAAHFVNNMMSQGACLIDANGVIEIQCIES